MPIDELINVPIERRRREAVSKNLPSIYLARHGETAGASRASTRGSLTCR
jgi:hypothetical protein